MAADSQGLNPVLPCRPAVFDVHELVHGEVRQGEADGHLLLAAAISRTQGMLTPAPSWT